MLATRQVPTIDDVVKGLLKQQLEYLAGLEGRLDAALDSGADPESPQVQEISDLLVSCSELYRQEYDRLAAWVSSVVGVSGVLPAGLHLRV